MKLNKGFTLVELVVALVVALVVLSVGIPAFSTLIENNRAAADSNALVTALQLARSEAVKRGVQVSVCAGNGTAASPTPTACSGSNDWVNGFLAVVNGNVLRRWDRFDGTVTIGDKSGDDVNQVNFAPDGASVDASANPQGVCLEMVRGLAKGAQYQRWLGVFTTGRIRVSKKKDEVTPPC